jgi:hypothetical protein
MNRFIKDKFRNVNAISFTAYPNELIINFSGFEEDQDRQEFLEFIFHKIKMSHTFTEGPPTIH